MGSPLFQGMNWLFVVGVAKSEEERAVPAD